MGELIQLVHSPDPATAAGAQEELIQVRAMLLKPPPMEVVMLNDAGRVPTRSHSNDAGVDLYVSENVMIPIGGFHDVPVGVAVKFPQGWWGRITGRSSTWRQRGLLVLEGVIDEGYRGELFIGVMNMNTDRNVTIKQGERVAQLILHPTSPDFPIEVVEKFDDETERGSAGFGSSGL